MATKSATFSETTKVESDRPAYPHVALRLKGLGHVNMSGDLLIVPALEWTREQIDAFNALCDAFKLREPQRAGICDAIQAEQVLAALTAAIVP
jgi:hypothetical protein